MPSARPDQAPCPRPSLNLDPPANALLLAPSTAAAGDDACTDLLAPVDPAAMDLLLVTTDRTPDERLAAWAASESRPPARGGVVGVDDTRSAVASADGPGCAGPSVGDRRFHRTAVAGPGDLIGLGTAVSRALRAWDDDGNRPVVCVRSLTDLLGHAEDRLVFRLLHTLTSLVETADGVAHYHMDPEAHDEHTLRTFRSLFDVVLEHDGDGWHRTPGPD